MVQLQNTVNLLRESKTAATADHLKGKIGSGILSGLS